MTKKYVSLLTKLTISNNFMKLVIVLALVVSPLVTVFVYVYTLSKQPAPLLYIAKEFPTQSIEVMQLEQFGAKVDTRDIYALLTDFIRSYDQDLSTNKDEILNRLKYAYTMCLGEARKKIVNNSLSAEEILKKKIVVTDYNFVHMLIVAADAEKGTFSVDVDYIKRFKQKNGKIFKKYYKMNYKLQTIDRHDYMAIAKEKGLEYAKAFLYGVAISDFKTR